MSFDIGDVLTQAWQITWKNKSLWWFGIILTLIVFPFLIAFLLPISIPFLLENQRTNSIPFLIPLLLMGFIFVIIIFFVIIYLFTVLMSTSIALGAWRAAEGKERVALVELLKNSLPFFWRVLGVMLLYAAVLMVINIGVQIFITVISLVTLGFGALCAMPLTLLLYPVMFIASVWLELAINGIVIDKMMVMEAVKQGWQMIRNNILAVALVTVVVYFGISIITSILVTPVMAPVFIILFGFLNSKLNWIVLAVATLLGLLFVPVFALISGWSNTFVRSIWVLTYLRLKHSVKPNTELQEVSA